MFNSSLFTVDKLKKGLLKLHHRGPDSSSHFVSGPYIGGMVRLSINDISSGGQPFVSPDNNIVVFYNGEISSPSLRAHLEALSLTSFLALTVK